MASSVYIHIPFCRQICSYCDFPKFFYFDKWIKPYLRALEKEIQATYKGEEIATIYIGGGTPSLLKEEDLETLLSLTNLFKKKKDVEFTVEANAEDLSLKKIELFSTYGVNRVSIGVQTFHKRLGDILERHTSYEMVEQGMKRLHQKNIFNINVDLIYAIPTETLQDVKEDLLKVLTLPITHISTYSLILEEHTKLYLKKIPLVGEELDVKMYQTIQSILKGFGFIQYEISNFSKPNFFSKHNLVYWNNEEYYGFGLGASSYIDGVRKTNTRSLTAYFEGKEGQNEEKVDRKKNMEYEMILGLRKTEGVSRKKFYEKYQKQMEEVFPIHDLEKQGLLKRNNNFIRIPDHKIYLSNAILVFFLLEE